jgi:hypothetical protein
MFESKMLKESYSDIDEFVADVKYKFVKYAEHSNWLILDDGEYNEDNKICVIRFLLPDGTIVIVSVRKDLSYSVQSTKESIKYGNFITTKRYSVNGIKENNNININDTLKSLDNEMSKI